MHKEPIIGIDLGTTNSCAAIVEDSGNVKLIPYKGGEYTIPSIFAIDDKGNELIGYEAKRQWQLNPKNTIYGAKRLVGLPFKSDIVEQMKQVVAYSMRPGKRNDDGSRTEMEVKVGDKVLYSKYAGTDIKLGTDEYVLLAEKDILAIVN